ncbi:MAG: hypothetical protein K2N51_13225 [Lachnospiraceae bacterium]|nr:hypothetical protein [Lachnospiraceae bacterium]
MSYFITDVKKIYKNKLVKWMLVFLLVVMIADPISVYVINARYENFFEEIGANPFQFWLLMNSSSWGNTVVYTLLFVLPVISTGLVFYNERQSSVYKWLIIRNSKAKYYISKIAATFLVTWINFFILFSINIIVTYFAFSADAPKTEQYMYLIPKKEMFSYPFYQSNPLSMVMLYVFLNALAIALLSLFALAVHEIINLKNRYVAILFPFIALYLINYGTTFLLIDHLNYKLSVIIQPRAASALTNNIQSMDVIIVFLVVALVDLVLLGVGYIRNGETL